LQEKIKLDDSSRLDVVEIARVPDMLPSFFPFLVGLRTYQHPGTEMVIIVAEQKTIKRGSKGN